MRRGDVDPETWGRLCSARLVPQAPYSGGVADGRRGDGSWVRGVVWAACEILEEDGFAHDRALEAEVEETFKAYGRQSPIRLSRDAYCPEALAGKHRDLCQGEQLALG